MIIRPEHVLALTPLIEKDFAARLADELKSLHGEAVVWFDGQVKLVRTLPKAVIERLALAGIGRARKHGLSSQESLSAFIVLMFEIAPNFDEDPAARTLDDQVVPPERRVQELEKRLTSADRGRMNRSYDPAAWQEPKSGSAT